MNHNDATCHIQNLEWYARMEKISPNQLLPVVEEVMLSWQKTNSLNDGEKIIKNYLDDYYKRKNAQK